MASKGAELDMGTLINIIMATAPSKFVGRTPLLRVGEMVSTTLMAF